MALQDWACLDCSLLSSLLVGCFLSLISNFLGSPEGELTLTSYASARLLLCSEVGNCLCHYVSLLNLHCLLSCPPCFGLLDYSFHSTDWVYCSVAWPTAFDFSTDSCLSAQWTLSIVLHSLIHLCECHQGCMQILISTLAELLVKPSSFMGKDLCFGFLCVWVV